MSYNYEDLRFLPRGGLAVDLAAVNEVPLEREVVVEHDTKRMKVGDGVSHYNDLDYFTTDADIWLRVHGDFIEFSRRGETGPWYTLFDLNDLPTLEGSKGDPGLSAYAIAVENGFVGTAAAWIDSLQGAQGPQGDRGLQGERGPQGDKGDTGEQGEQGIQGPKGDQGDPGDTGARGERGLQGLKGDQGDIGPKGDKGDKGDPGEQGIAGAQGPKGRDGTINWIVLNLVDPQPSYIDDFGLHYVDEFDTRYAFDPVTGTGVVQLQPGMSYMVRTVPDITMQVSIPPSIPIRAAFAIHSKGGELEIHLGNFTIPRVDGSLILGDGETVYLLHDSVNHLEIV